MSTWNPAQHLAFSVASVLDKIVETVSNEMEIVNGREILIGSVETEGTVHECCTSHFQKQLDKCYCQHRNGIDITAKNQDWEPKSSSVCKIFDNHLNVASNGKRKDKQVTKLMSSHRSNYSDAIQEDRLNEIAKNNKSKFHRESDMIMSCERSYDNQSDLYNINIEHGREKADVSVVLNKLIHEVASLHPVTEIVKEVQVSYMSVIGKTIESAIGERVSSNSVRRQERQASLFSALLESKEQRDKQLKDALLATVHYSSDIFQKSNTDPNEVVPVNESSIFSLSSNISLTNTNCQPGVSNRDNSAKPVCGDLYSSAHVEDQVITVPTSSDNEHSNASFSNSNISSFMNKDSASISGIESLNSSHLTSDPEVSHGGSISPKQIFQQCNSLVQKQPTTKYSKSSSISAKVSNPAVKTSQDHMQIVIDVKNAVPSTSQAVNPTSVKQSESEVNRQKFCGSSNTDTQYKPYRSKEILKELYQALKNTSVISQLHSDEKLRAVKELQLAIQEAEAILEFSPELSEFSLHLMSVVEKLKQQLNFKNVNIEQPQLVLPILNTTSENASSKQSTFKELLLGNKSLDKSFENDVEMLKGTSRDSPNKHLVTSTDVQYVDAITSENDGQQMSDAQNATKQVSNTLGVKPSLNIARVEKLKFQLNKLKISNSGKFEYGGHVKTDEHEPTQKYKSNCEQIPVLCDLPCSEATGHSSNQWLPKRGGKQSHSTLHSDHSEDLGNNSDSGDDCLIINCLGSPAEGKAREHFKESNHVTDNSSGNSSKCFSNIKLEKTEFDQKVDQDYRNSVCRLSERSNNEVHLGIAEKTFGASLVKLNAGVPNVRKATVVEDAELEASPKPVLTIVDDSDHKHAEKIFITSQRKPGIHLLDRSEEVSVDAVEDAELEASPKPLLTIVDDNNQKSAEKAFIASHRKSDVDLLDRSGASVSAADRSELETSTRPIVTVVDDNDQESAEKAFVASQGKGGVKKTCTEFSANLQVCALNDSQLDLPLETSGPAVRLFDVNDCGNTESAFVAGQGKTGIDKTHRIEMASAVDAIDIEIPIPAVKNSDDKDKKSDNKTFIVPQRKTSVELLNNTDETACAVSSTDLEMRPQMSSRPVKLIEVDDRKNAERTAQVETDVHLLKNAETLSSANISNFETTPVLRFALNHIENKIHENDVRAVVALQEDTSVDVPNTLEVVNFADHNEFEVLPERTKAALTPGNDEDHNSAFIVLQGKTAIDLPNSAKVTDVVEGTDFKIPPKTPRPEVKLIEDKDNENAERAFIASQSLTDVDMLINAEAANVVGTDFEIPPETPRPAMKLIDDNDHESAERAFIASQRLTNADTSNSAETVAVVDADFEIPPQTPRPAIKLIDDKDHESAERAFIASQRKTSFDLPKNVKVAGVGNASFAMPPKTPRPAIKLIENKDCESAETLLMASHESNKQELPSDTPEIPTAMATVRPGGNDHNSAERGQVYKAAVEDSQEPRQKEMDDDDDSECCEVEFLTDGEVLAVLNSQTSKQSSTERNYVLEQVEMHKKQKKGKKGLLAIADQLAQNLQNSLDYESSSSPVTIHSEDRNRFARCGMGKHSARHSFEQDREIASTVVSNNIVVGTTNTPSIMNPVLSTSGQTQRLHHLPESTTSFIGDTSVLLSKALLTPSSHVSYLTTVKQMNSLVQLATASSSSSLYATSNSHGATGIPYSTPLVAPHLHGIVGPTVSVPQQRPFTKHTTAQLEEILQQQHCHYISQEQELARRQRILDVQRGQVLQHQQRLAASLNGDVELRIPDPSLILMMRNQQQTIQNAKRGEVLNRSTGFSSSQFQQSTQQQKLPQYSQIRNSFLPSAQANVPAAQVKMGSRAPPPPYLSTSQRMFSESYSSSHYNPLLGTNVSTEIRPPIAFTQAMPPVRIPRHPSAGLYNPRNQLQYDQYQQQQYLNFSNQRNAEVVNPFLDAVPAQGYRPRPLIPPYVAPSYHSPQKELSSYAPKQQSRHQVRQLISEQAQHLPVTSLDVSSVVPLQSTLESALRPQSNVCQNQLLRGSAPRSRLPMHQEVNIPVVRPGQNLTGDNIQKVLKHREFHYQQGSSNNKNLLSNQHVPKTHTVQQHQISSLNNVSTSNQSLTRNQPILSIQATQQQHTVLQQMLQQKTSLPPPPPPLLVHSKKAVLRQSPRPPPLYDASGAVAVPATVTLSSHVTTPVDSAAQIADQSNVRKLASPDMVPLDLSVSKCQEAITFQSATEPAHSTAKVLNTISDAQSYIQGIVNNVVSDILSTQPGQGDTIKTNDEEFDVAQQADKSGETVREMSSTTDTTGGKIILKIKQNGAKNTDFEAEHILKPAAAEKAAPKQKAKKTVAPLETSKENAIPCQLLDLKTKNLVCTECLVEYPLMLFRLKARKAVHSYSCSVMKAPRKSLLLFQCKACSFQFTTKDPEVLLQHDKACINSNSRSSPKLIQTNRVDETTSRREACSPNTSTDTLPYCIESHSDDLDSDEHLVSSTTGSPEMESGTVAPVSQTVIDTIDKVARSCNDQLDGAVKRNGLKMVIRTTSSNSSKSLIGNPVEKPCNSMYIIANTNDYDGDIHEVASSDYDISSELDDDADDFDGNSESISADNDRSRDSINGTEEDNNGDSDTGDEHDINCNINEMPEHSIENQAIKLCKPCSVKMVDGKKKLTDAIAAGDMVNYGELVLWGLVEAMSSSSDISGESDDEFSSFAEPKLSYEFQPTSDLNGIEDNNSNGNQVKSVKMIPGAIENSKSTKVSLKDTSRNLTCRGNTSSGTSNKTVKHTIASHNIVNSKSRLAKKKTSNKILDQSDNCDVDTSTKSQQGLDSVPVTVTLAKENNCNNNSVKHDFANTCKSSTPVDHQLLPDNITDSSNIQCKSRKDNNSEVNELTKSVRQTSLRSTGKNELLKSIQPNASSVIVRARCTDKAKIVSKPNTSSEEAEDAMLTKSTNNENDLDQLLIEELLRGSNVEQKQFSPKANSGIEKDITAENVVLHENVDAASSAKTIAPRCLKENLILTSACQIEKMLLEDQTPSNTNTSEETGSSNSNSDEDDGPVVTFVEDICPSTKKLDPCSSLPKHLPPHLPADPCRLILSPQPCTSTSILQLRGLETMMSRPRIIATCPPQPRALPQPYIFTPVLYSSETSNSTQSSEIPTLRPQIQQFVLSKPTENRSSVASRYPINGSRCAVRQNLPPQIPTTTSQVFPTSASDNAAPNSESLLSLAVTNVRSVRDKTEKHPVYSVQYMLEQTTHTVAATFEEVLTEAGKSSCKSSEHEQLEERLSKITSSSNLTTNCNTKDVVPNKCIIEKELFAEKQTSAARDILEKNSKKKDESEAAGVQLAFAKDIHSVVSESVDSVTSRAIPLPDKLEYIVSTDRNLSNELAVAKEHTLNDSVSNLKAAKHDCICKEINGVTYSSPGLNVVNDKLYDNSVASVNNSLEQQENPVGTAVQYWQSDSCDSISDIFAESSPEALETKNPFEEIFAKASRNSLIRNVVKENGNLNQLPDKQVLLEACVLEPNNSKTGLAREAVDYKPSSVFSAAVDDLQEKIVIDNLADVKIDSQNNQRNLTDHLEYINRESANTDADKETTTHILDSKAAFAKKELQTHSFSSTAKGKVASIHQNKQLVGDIVSCEKNFANDSCEEALSNIISTEALLNEKLSGGPNNKMKPKMLTEKESGINFKPPRKLTESRGTQASLGKPKRQRLNVAQTKCDNLPSVAMAEFAIRESADALIVSHSACTQVSAKELQSLPSTKVPTLELLSSASSQTSVRELQSLASSQVPVKDERSLVRSQISKELQLSANNDVSAIEIQSSPNAQVSAKELHSAATVQIPFGELQHSPANSWVSPMAIHSSAGTEMQSSANVQVSAGDLQTTVSTCTSNNEVYSSASARLSSGEVQSAANALTLASDILPSTSGKADSRVASQPAGTQVSACELLQTFADIAFDSECKRNTSTSNSFAPEQIKCISEIVDKLGDSTGGVVKLQIENTTENPKVAEVDEDLTKKACASEESVESIAGVKRNVWHCIELLFEDTPVQSPKVLLKDSACCSTEESASNEVLLDSTNKQVETVSASGATSVGNTDMLQMEKPQQISGNTDTVINVAASKKYYAESNDDTAKNDKDDSNRNAAPPPSTKHVKIHKPEFPEFKLNRFDFVGAFADHLHKAEEEEAKTASAEYEAKRQKWQEEEARQKSKQQEKRRKVKKGLLREVAGLLQDNNNGKKWRKRGLPDNSRRASKESPNKIGASSPSQGRSRERSILASVRVNTSSSTIQQQQTTETTQNNATKPDVDPSDRSTCRRKRKLRRRRKRKRESDVCQLLKTENNNGSLQPVNDSSERQLQLNENDEDLHSVQNSDKIVKGLTLKPVDTCEYGSFVSTMLMDSPEGMFPGLSLVNYFTSSEEDSQEVKEDHERSVINNVRKPNLETSVGKTESVPLLSEIIRSRENSVSKPTDPRTLARSKSLPPEHVSEPKDLNTLPRFRPQSPEIMAKSEGNYACEPTGPLTLAHSKSQIDCVVKNTTSTSITNNTTSSFNEGDTLPDLPAVHELPFQRLLRECGRPMNENFFSSGQDKKTRRGLARQKVLVTSSAHKPGTSEKVVSHTLKNDENDGSSTESMSECSSDDEDMDKKYNLSSLLHQTVERHHDVSPSLRPNEVSQDDDKSSREHLIDSSEETLKVNNIIAVSDVGTNKASRNMHNDKLVVERVHTNQDLKLDQDVSKKLIAESQYVPCIQPLSNIKNIVSSNESATVTEKAVPVSSVSGFTCAQILNVNPQCSDHDDDFKPSTKNLSPLSAKITQKTHTMSLTQTNSKNKKKVSGNLFSRMQTRSTSPDLSKKGLERRSVSPNILKKESNTTPVSFSVFKKRLTRSQSPSKTNNCLPTKLSSTDIGKKSLVTTSESLTLSSKSIITRSRSPNSSSNILIANSTVSHNGLVGKSTSLNASSKGMVAMSKSPNISCKKSLTIPLVRSNKCSEGSVRLSTSPNVSNKGFKSQNSREVSTNISKSGQELHPEQCNKSSHEQRGRSSQKQHERSENLFIRMAKGSKSESVHVGNIMNKPILSPPLSRTEKEKDKPVNIFKQKVNKRHAGPENLFARMTRASSRERNLDCMPPIKRKRESRQDNTSSRFRSAVSPVQKPTKISPIEVAGEVVSLNVPTSGKISKISASNFFHHTKKLSSNKDSLTKLKLKRLDLPPKKSASNKSVFDFTDSDSLESVPSLSVRQHSHRHKDLEIENTGKLHKTKRSLFKKTRVHISKQRKAN